VRAVGDELEDRIGAQGVVVALVLVAGQDAEGTGPDYLQEGVLGQLRVARVVEYIRELPGRAVAFVELPQWQQAGVSGERSFGHLDSDGQQFVGIEVEGSNRL
jgi:hypothetical protein